MNTVHVEEKGSTMNPGATSKAAIMQVCRRIAAQEGLSVLSMRTVARACGVALGMSLSTGASASISGIAGIGHILTGVGIILLLVSLKGLEQDRG